MKFGYLLLSAIVLVSFALAGCQTTTTSPRVQAKPEVCSVSNEARFQAAANTLRAAFAKEPRPYWTSFEVNRCGYVEIDLKKGGQAKASFSSMYAKVGSPSWQIDIATKAYFTRPSKLGKYKARGFGLIIDYPSNNGRTVTAGELSRMNSALNTLALMTLGTGNIKVDINKELQGAAALQKAGARNRTALGVLASAAAAAGAAAPAHGIPSGSSKPFICKVTCTSSRAAHATGLGSSVDISVTVSAVSRPAAEKYTDRNQAKICESRGLMSQTQFFQSCKEG